MNTDHESEKGSSLGYQNVHPIGILWQQSHNCDLEFVITFVNATFVGYVLMINGCSSAKGDF